MCMLHEDEWAHVSFCSYLLSEFQSKMSVFPFQTAYMPNNPTSRFPSWDYPDSSSGWLHLVFISKQLHRLQGDCPMKNLGELPPAPSTGLTKNRSVTRSFPARRSVEISPRRILEHLFLGGRKFIQFFAMQRLCQLCLVGLAVGQGGPRWHKLKGGQNSRQSPARALQWCILSKCDLNTSTAAQFFKRVLFELIPNYLDD